VIARLAQRLFNLTDEQLERQASPERNRLIYLLGHLTVAHDKMRILLRMSDRFHPELDSAFFDHPDRLHSHQFRGGHKRRLRGPDSLHQSISSIRWSDAKEVATGPSGLKRSPMPSIWLTVTPGPFCNDANCPFEWNIL
jgi:hypothetical protein